MRISVLIAASGLLFLMTVAEASAQETGSSPKSTVRTTDHAPATPKLEDLPLRERISQHGITWTFEKPTRVGQFATGDWYAVGPVKVIGIAPPSVTEEDGSVRHGSMLNPRVLDPVSKAHQGYDSRLPYYDAGLNVAKDVSADKPLEITAGNSLVSMISYDAPKKDTSAASRRPNSVAATWALLRAAAVLTVLDAPAPTGSFRPAYSAADKSVRYTVSDMDYSVLGKLKAVAGAPDRAQAERYFERPWIDHMVMQYQLEDNAPAENMPRVGVDACRLVEEGSLLLNLDIPDTDKERLLARFVQLGLDLYGIVTTGDFGRNAYLSAGSHRSGRKWPIIVAGMVLHDEGMKNVQGVFAEDVQVYYYDDPSLPDGVRGKKGWTGATVLYGRVTRGKRLTYEHKHPSEWTVDGRGKPGDPRAGSDSDRRQESYRQCCTGGTWVGMALCARLMGAVSYWNCPEFFDYVDRVMTEPLNPLQKVIEKETGKPMRMGTRPHDESFVGRMWQAYRPQSGPLFGARELTRPADGRTDDNPR